MKGVQVEVWGPYALFTRPELKVERVSYDVMTPSAARGLLDSIYFHPGMHWFVDRIYVLNPIQFTNIRRNEVKDKILARDVRSVMTGSDKELAIYTGKSIQQRASMLLTNVHYVIDAHFEMTDKAVPSDNEGKFIDIMRRRLSRGQCYHQPYFGCREFPAKFRAWSGDAIPTINETRSLGLMLYDMDYSDPQNIQPMFFQANLEDGILEIAGKEILR